MPSIPPIQAGSAYHGGHNPVQELEKYIKEYGAEIAAWEKDPTEANLHKLQHLAKKIEHFIQHNKKQIENAAKAMGWPPTSSNGTGYDDFIHSSLEGLYNVIHLTPGEKPVGPLYFTNEQITQLHWLCTTHSRS